MLKCPSLGRSDRAGRVRDEFEAVVPFVLADKLGAGTRHVIKSHLTSRLDLRNRNQPSELPKIADCARSI